MARILIISGKVSDMFSATYEEDGKIMTVYDGYVPRNLNIGGGDYIDLQIDMDTGKILDWSNISTDVILNELGGEVSEEEFEYIGDED